MSPTRASSSPKALGTFRTLGTLRVVNVVAVGSSLAGATGAVLQRIMGGAADDSFAFASACTTLVFGLGWAALLRDRRTIGGTPLRWGWLASIPLAIANAASACGLLMMSDGGGASMRSFLKGAVLGATFGAIIWIPALICTLVAFGVPIAWAQHRATRGLAGEERGELVIGLASAMIAAASLVLLGADSSVTWVAVAIAAIAAIGLVTGGLATAFAARRESVRRGFVRSVEAGDVEGYRVDQTHEGKVLIRVTSMGQGYRVANFEEHLAVLDENGEARRGQV